MQIFSNKVFNNPIKIIEATTKDQMEFAFKEIEKYRTSKYLVGFISYDFDYMYFEVFEKYEEYKPQKVDKPFGIIAKPMISKLDYFENIEKIKQYISEGVTYEVNYTYPYEIQTNLTDIELYDKLLERQKTPYNAFLQNSKFTILSFSPELFFKIKENKILTKPMKGTVSRGENEEDDLKNKEFLYNDVKNRAENVMIVDLLRNDLGRIAETSTVNVDKLFEIETHSTLFQMTSEISAQIRKNTSLFEIFNAIFPCGSITGAPKVSTMKVIKEIETFNRGVYCGAIGFISPDEVLFSVPIRILQTKSEKTNGKSKKFIYNVGGAIVWDSTASDEWEETIIKKKFLETEFSLIETFNSHHSKHIERMKTSAKDLGFVWNEELEKLKFKDGELYRLTLERTGEYSIEKPVLKPRLAAKDGKNYIKIGSIVNTSNPFLYHKTTVREQMPMDVYDEIRINELGQITEGTFTNIGAQFGNVIYTPPVKCGLLNGILRQIKLEKGEICEKVLYLEDLKKADKIWCFNSVRGFVEVNLC
jgi:para-aminobenzoate synthetase/4-amino-4-deoxychorismate lyase